MFKKKRIFFFFGFSNTLQCTLVEWALEIQLIGGDIIYIACYMDESTIQFIDDHLCCLLLTVKSFLFFCYSLIGCKTFQLATSYC